MQVKLFVVRRTAIADKFGTHQRVVRKWKWFAEFYNGPKKLGTFTSTFSHQNSAPVVQDAQAFIGDGLGIDPNLTEVRIETGKGIHP